MCQRSPHFGARPFPHPEAHVVETRALERAKSFFFRHFEQIFVLLLVASLLGIHYLVEQKLAFLSFYYLATILAGSYGGRRLAVMSGVFIVVLVFFFQAIVGLDMLPGFYEDALLTLVPWAGFLILTGYVVGRLAEERQQQLNDVKNAYLATLELLTFHLESTERHQQGHSHRVSVLATAIARERKLTEAEVENVRVAALLHEVGTQDQRLLRLLSRSVTGGGGGRGRGGGGGGGAARAVRGCPPTQRPGGRR